LHGRNHASQVRARTCLFPGNHRGGLDDIAGPQVRRRMSGSIKVALVLVVIATLPACFFPHRAYRTPVIHGTMSVGARPVSALPLRVIAEPTTEASCTGTNLLETSTAADGRFQFCPMPDFQFFIHMMAHRTFRWNVCAKVNDEWTVVQRSSRYTLVDSGPYGIERIDCDVGTGGSCTRVSDTGVTREKLRAALGAQRCRGVSK
jgi:hypothetical protein